MTPRGLTLSVVSPASEQRQAIAPPGWADRLVAMVASWRADAAVLRRCSAVAQAEVLEQCASQLEQQLVGSAIELELLTIEAAAAVTGYSASGLRKMLKRADLVNYGGPHRPRLRRGDLARLPRVRRSS